MGAGYIYVLSNSSMPDLVKIGFTYRRVEDRLLELSSATGVPTPFLIEYYCLTGDVEEVEKAIHGQYSSVRRPGREFFAITVADAITTADSLIRPVKPHRFCRVEPKPPKSEPDAPPCTDIVTCTCGERLSIPPRFRRLAGLVPLGSFPRLRCPKCSNLVQPYPSEAAQP